MHSILVRQISIALLGLLYVAPFAAQAQMTDRWYILNSDNMTCADFERRGTPNDVLDSTRYNAPKSIGAELKWLNDSHAVIESGRLQITMIRGQNACDAEVSRILKGKSQTEKQILEIVELVEVGNPREAVVRFHGIADPNDPALAEHHFDTLSAILARSAVGENSGAFVNFLHTYLITYIGNSRIEDADSQVEAGISAFEANVGEAFQHLAPLAMRGSSVATFELAKGLARWRDNEWARVLAEYYAIQSIGMDMDAQYLLEALNTEDHLYFPKDQTGNLIGTAVSTWFEPYAHQLNSPIAQHRFGWFCQYRPEYTRHAKQGPRDTTLIAVSWFEKAIEQGNLDSMFELAKIYAEPYGVAADREESDRLLQLAASLGHEPAKDEITRKSAESARLVARNEAAVRSRIKEQGEQDRCLAAPQRYALEKLRDFESTIRTSSSNGERCAEMAEAWYGQLKGLMEVYDSRVLFQDPSNDPSWCGMAKNIRHYDDTYRQQLDPNCL